MGTRYQHRDIVQRCTIDRLLAAKHPPSQIAAAVGCAPSTVSRAQKRNAAQTAGYQHQYKSKSGRPAAGAGPPLSGFPSGTGSGTARAGGGAAGAGVRAAGHCGREHLPLCLPRGKSKRGYRGRRGGTVLPRTPGWAPLSERSPEAADRRAPGHWEADLMRFGNLGQSLLLHERHSRLLLEWRQGNKAADPIANALRRLLSSPPAVWRRSVAFDNCSEFARHQRRHTAGIRTCFCAVKAPWQKGGVENAIGRWRFLPRRADLKRVKAADVAGHPGVQQHAAALPGLPDAGRSIRRRSVALAM